MGREAGSRVWREKSRGTQRGKMEREAGRGEQVEMTAERELYIFQKRKQENYRFLAFADTPFFPSGGFVCTRTWAGWQQWRWKLSL